MSATTRRARASSTWVAPAAATVDESRPLCSRSIARRSASSATGSVACLRDDQLDDGRIGIDAVGRLQDECDVLGEEWRGLVRHQLGVLHQDRGFDLAELAAGLDAELLDEHVACSLVRGQRVDLPTGSVERDHEVSTEAFAVRVAAHEPLELCDVDVATERELGVDPVFDRADPRLLEPWHLERRERLVGEVGERRLAPQSERLTEEHRRPGDAPMRCERPCDADQAFEPEQVHLLGVDGEDVSRRLGQQHRRLGARAAVRLERLAQVRDVDLQRRCRPLRRLVTPEPVDKAVGGDGTGWRRGAASRAPTAAWAPRG